MTKRVGVVVPCKNEAATIDRCLASLRAQEPSPERIVVVDNGSTDGSREIAARLADEVLLLPDLTIGAMRNHGAQVIGEVDVLAFVDADCEIAPGWVAAALEALATAELVGWRSDASTGAPWVAARWAAVEARQAHRQSYVWSQHLAIRADVFHKLGGFDESLPTAEDVDLSRRVLATGGRIQFVPGMAAVHHGFPTSLRGFVRRERWHTRAVGWYRRMSTKSRAIVLGASAWTLLGIVAVGRAASTQRARPLAAWGIGTAAAVPGLGVVGGRSARTCLQDGILLGIWTGIRVARLPQELRNLQARS